MSGLPLLYLKNWKISDWYMDSQRFEVVFKKMVFLVSKIENPKETKFKAWTATSHWNCIENDLKLTPFNILVHPVYQRPPKLFLYTPQEREGKTYFFAWLFIAVPQKSAEISKVKILSYFSKKFESPKRILWNISEINKDVEQVHGKNWICTGWPNSDNLDFFGSLWRIRWNTIGVK